MICELHLRLTSIGFASDAEFEFPITQIELAETLGISPVHANRVLQSLRNQNLVDVRAGSVAIPDVGRLRKFAGFNPNYLHLGTASRTQH